ncbi:hypothetical protein ACETK8_04010 [Brevundimonas staleyi]|uniref:Oligosaccharide repeat unit polymerase n=1 Tax=Brevundimonas staleyi TaxID=74326 RepID=A0ABW0FWZ8_9CAUL
MTVFSKQQHDILSSSSRNKRLLLAFLATCAFVGFTIYCVTKNTESLATQISLVAVLVALISYGSVVLWLEASRGELFSPIALFSASVLAHFGVTGLLYPDPDVFVSRRNYDFLVPSIFYSFAFVFVYNIAGYAILQYKRHSRNGNELTAWGGRGVYIAIGILLLIGVSARFIIIDWNVYLQTSLATLEGARHIKFIGTVRQFELFPNYAAYIALIYAFSQFKQHNIKAYNFAMRVGIALVVFNLIYWLPTGKKFPIIATTILPIMILYLYQKRLPPLRLLVVAIVFVGALFPLTHAYRVSQAQAFSGRNVDDLGSTLAAVGEAMVSSSSSQEMGARNRTFGRLNQNEPVAGSIRIINDGEADLRWGVDYANVMTNMIPGFLWPDKPKVMYGNEFGHLTEMVQRTDPYTAISVTLIGESFLNFHIAGILVGGLLALIFCGIYILGRCGVCKETSTLLYVVATPTILYVGASFALYISSMIQTLVVVFLVAKCLEVRSSRRAAMMARSRGPAWANSAPSPGTGAA